MHRKLTDRLKRILLPIFCLGFAFVATDCAKNPVTGKRELVLISEGQEIAMGQEAHPEILGEFGAVADEGLQAYVSGVGQRLARISERPDLPWHFTVVDVPVVNAFAVPGGYIYVTREILAYMNNEAEMAGVLGHEIGHVTARHSVSQISKQQLFGLGLGLGSIFSPTFRQLSDLAQLGASLLFLKYSRDDERQSDQLGVRYMLESGYDPRELSDFFRVFEQMREESNQALPNWLASHPAPPDRIVATARQAEQLLSQTNASNLSVNREEFLRRIENLVFGENPREGFSQEGQFLHPELRFQLSYPLNWRVNNTRGAVVFLNPDGSSAVQLTLAPDGSTSPEQRAQQLASQPGVRFIDGRSGRIHGNQAFVGTYQIQSQQTGEVIRALVGIVAYQRNLYQLLGMASPQVFDRSYGVLESIISSFDELSEPRYLNVQPDRIRIHQVRRGETLDEVARRFRNPRVNSDELAKLNRLDPAQPLVAGALLKVVEPGR